MKIIAVQCAPTKRDSFSGKGTFYCVSQNTGACGWDNTDDQMVAALNKPQFGNNFNNMPECGKYAKVTGPHGSVTVKIVDQCPECASGSLDLSPAAFKALNNNNLNTGIIPITWSWVSGSSSSPSSPSSSSASASPSVNVRKQVKATSQTSSAAGSSSTPNHRHHMHRGHHQQ